MPRAQQKLCWFVTKNNTFIFILSKKIAELSLNTRTLLKKNHFVMYLNKQSAIVCWVNIWNYQPLKSGFFAEGAWGTLLRVWKSLPLFFYLNSFFTLFPAIFSKYIFGYVIVLCKNVPLFQWIKSEHFSMA